MFVKELPSVEQAPNGDIAVIQIVTDVLWFNKIGDDFVPRFFSKSSLSEGDGEFSFADERGQILRFFNFDSTIPEAKRGQFKSLTDPAGHTWVPTYDANHRVIDFVIGDSPAVGYFYSYYESGVNAGKRRFVTLKREETAVRRVEFLYHDGKDGCGCEGDLKLAIDQVWDGSKWADLGKTYHRFYTAGNRNGAEHGLKFVLRAEGYARMVAAGLDPCTASDGDLERFADEQFMFEDSEQTCVREEVVNALDYRDIPPEPRCFKFDYQKSNFSGPNAWKTKTTETLPDGNRNIIYSTDSGDPLLRVFQDSASGKMWGTYFQYNEKRQKVLEAASSAIHLMSEEGANLIDEGTPGLVKLRSDTGLIQIWEYYPSDDPASGAAAGYLRCKRVKLGTAGKEINLQEYLYTARTVGDITRWVPKKRVCYPSEEDQLFQIDCTAYTYLWYDEGFQIMERTTHWPIIPADQNGSGVSNKRVERFDEFGNRTWIKDERGFLTRLNYDLASGALIQRIVDVDTEKITDGPVVPQGWATPEGGGLHLVTDYTVDALGRATLELGPPHEIDIGGASTPIRRAKWTVYKDAEHEIRQAQGYGIWAEGESGVKSFSLIEPITVIKKDRSGRITDIILTKRAPGVTGALTAREELGDQSLWMRWRKNKYWNNSERQPDTTRVYFAIPSFGEGDAANNYSQTTFTQNNRRHLVRQCSPGGTITRNVFDSKGWLLEKWIGTNDRKATDMDPSGKGATGNSMKLVWSYEYDDGKPAHDGLLTREASHVDDSDTRQTRYEYDFRKRKIRKSCELESREDYAYDNQDRRVRTDRVNPKNGLLIERRETRYDNLGRAFRSIRQAANPDTVAIGQSLVSERWFDPSGRGMKQAPAGSKMLRKTAYDGAGRATHHFVSYNLSDKSYDTARSVANDTVMRQEATEYDSASNVILRTTRQRFHDATGVGPLTSPTGRQPKARVSYIAFWPDGIGQEQAKSEFGTNGGVNLSRPATIPLRSDTILITSTEYDAAGQPVLVTDPASKVTAYCLDAAGRIVSRIEDFGRLNRETAFAYNVDSKTLSRIAKNAITGDQIMEFIYGTTLEESGVARNDLLRYMVFDGPAPNRVEHGYNRQGQLIRKTDQNGTMRLFDYDKLGRLTDDRATKLGKGVDASTRRISRTYDARGLLTRIVCFDAPSDGNVVNEVKYMFDGFGQPIREYQSHTRPVDTATTPKVEYGYSDGSENHIRPTSMTYPDGRVIVFNYGPANGQDDLLSRVKTIQEGSTALVDYSYLGLKQVVRLSYPDEAGVELIYIKRTGEPNGDGGDPYTGLDRFGRVVDDCWLKTNDGTDLERVKYAYDRASNRKWRHNTVAQGGQDELYAYDTLYQLRQLQRGTLDQSETRIVGTPAWNEEFDFDPTGNWNGPICAYKTQVDGVTALDQNRAHDCTNEITEISTASGAAWPTPEHDAAGNCVRMPQPLNSGEAYQATYDAWNRLVQLRDRATVAATYAYDGLNRRVTKVVSGDTRHFYFSRDWQILEERAANLTTAEKQFVWGLRYKDDLAMRIKEEQRLYVASTRFQPTAAIDATGSVVERYGYTAYGAPTWMDSNFVDRQNSRFGWETLFAGYYFDHETGLYQVRHRYLHPKLGRWLTRDPFSQQSGGNRYLYVNGNPINAIDPLGLFKISDVSWCEWVWCIGVAKVCCCEAADSQTAVGEEQTNNSYPSGLDDTAVNAVAHCAWMCYVKSKETCNGFLALGLGAAHEACGSNSAHGKAMDFFNNSVGASLSENSLTDCWSACEDKANSFELYWHVLYHTGGALETDTYYPDFLIDGDGDYASGTIGASTTTPRTFP